MGSYKTFKDMKESQHHKVPTKEEEEKILKELKELHDILIKSRRKPRKDEKI